MDGDDSIPEPILNLRKKSAAMHIRNFDSSGEERSNNDRKRPYADAINGDKEGNGDNGNTLFCQEIGAASNVDPPARERPAVSACWFHSFHHVEYVIIVAPLTAKDSLLILLVFKRMEIGHSVSRSVLHAPSSFMAMDL